MPTFAQAVLGIGVVIPVHLFNQVFPGIFRNTGRDWVRTDRDIPQLGNLVTYYSEHEDEGINELFLTTNRAANAEEFHPSPIIDLPDIMYGSAEFENWVNQVFPQQAWRFGLTLYVYSRFD